jgi:hypothetical protein
MKWVLGSALVVSLAVNVWLLTSQKSGDPRGGEVPPDASAVIVEDVETPETSSPPKSERVLSEDTDALRALVAEMEKELEVTRKKADILDSLDPLAVVIYSNNSLLWRVRKLLGIEAERERMLGAWKFGRELAGKEGTAAEILDALNAESDPGVLALLGEILRAGAASKATAEERRAFGELLLGSPVADVRKAAVRGVHMSGIRGSSDDAARALREEMNSLLVEALWSESSPEVVGAIARAFSDFHPPRGSLDALKDAAGRLPPSDGRREVWKAIARGTFREDRGGWLVEEFQNAAVQDVRDDVAAGLARAGNSMGGGYGPGTPEERAKRMEEARERFRIVYRGTSDPDVRRDLVRAALHGLGCVRFRSLDEDHGADAAAFFREIVAMEPDEIMRERLERVAQVFEGEGLRGSAHFGRIMAGKE